MADLTDQQSAESVKITGSDSTGVETNFVNANSNGSLQVHGEGVAGTPSGGVVSVQGVSGGTPIAATQSGTWTFQPGNTANTTPWLVTDSSDGPVTPGTVASKSSLIGGQFNSSLPNLTTGQQSAIQIDSNGRLLISSTTTPITTGNNTQVSVSNSVSTQILASNLSRKMAYISNNNSKSLWISIGSTAVVGRGIEIGGGGSFGIDSTGLWTGVINGIMAGGSPATIDVFEGTP